MAYALNSAKDSKGDEDQYVALATANAQKIYAYKAAHGGDFEHAFQAVTGKPWPEGRSLKMHDGQAEMTKDRTVKSVLGKYVLPAAAAVIAPWALGAIGGAGGTTALGSMLPGAEGGVAAGAAGAGTGVGAGVGATAAATGSGLWSKLASPLITTGIQAGTNLLGTKMQVDASKDAAKIEAQSAKEALDWQKAVYGQRQEQLAPAIGVGNGATLALGNLMGIRAPEGGYHAPPAPGAAPAAAAAPATPAPASTPAQPQTVQMRSPTGQVQAVPVEQVQHYQQLGATVVQ